MRLSLFSILLAACASHPPTSPFSAQEIARALEPAKRLEKRCYQPSESGRRSQRVAMDFNLEVQASGAVESVPTLAEPREPALVECFRHALNELRFPAKGRDRLELHFELGPPRPAI